MSRLNTGCCCVKGHVDMVTEKNSDVVHDFFNDPLRLQSDGAWLKVCSQVDILQHSLSLYLNKYWPSLQYCKDNAGFHHVMCRRKEPH